MKCPECGIEIEDNELFCTACGAEIITAIPNMESGNKKKPEKKMSIFKNKKKNDTEAAANTASTEKNKKKRKFAGIVVLAAIAVIAIIIIVFSIVSAVKSNEGRKLLEKIPLGRDIDIIEAETEMNFVDTSVYGAVGHIADFDYICESEDDIVVGGITVPKWAVVLKKSPTDSVAEATLLNFNAIKHNWMGEKTALEIDLAAIEFGSTIKKTERSLGMKPYTIIKNSKSNTSVYIYRYHYIDDATENTIVKNLYITVDDVEEKVTDVRDVQVDYMKLILGSE